MIAYRFDPGVMVTALGRYLPSLLSSGTDVAKLTGPFSKVCVWLHVGSCVCACVCEKDRVSGSQA